MNDVTLVQCPYCFEQVEVFFDPETVGSLVEDCEVCCRPWQIYVSRDAEGRISLQVERAQ